ncbi:MAG: hypothetical protein ACJ76H_08145 [Bacteriovoracaceae bacterium]
MKFAALLLLVISFSATAAPEFWNTNAEGKTRANKLVENYDESVNYQPGLDLYSEAGALTDLYGAHGSQLCAPNALTHMFYYLKYAHEPKFSNLMSAPDMDNDGTANTFRDQIRYFFNLCSTDRETGTLYQTALECMKTYVVNSGYTPWAWMIGAHSQDGNNTQTTVSPDVLRYYLANKIGVVMMIGWYKPNANGGHDRTGGHFFNVYGYDYSAAWGSETIVLKVVNSWVNYAGRDRSQMFDNITMKKLTTGIDHVEYELSGPGLEFDGYKALVDDILVVLPVTQ